MRGGIEASALNIMQIESLPVTADQLRRATQYDLVLSKVLQFVLKGWPTQVSDELRPFWLHASELSVENDIVLWGVRVVIPTKLRSKVLNELHENHPGISKMKALARSHVWWPKIDNDIENLVSACVACQSVKSAPPLTPLQPWPWPTRPFQRVHIDFAGPFCGKMFFLLVDAHSKWPEVVEMNRTTAVETIDVLRQWFAAHGLPEQLVSDNGPQFVSKEFKQFTSANGIKHIYSAPYHPATNGLVERFVQTFKQAMKAGAGNGLSFQHRLSAFLLPYRTTPHTVTNVAPCQLFLKRALRAKLDLLRQTTEQAVGDEQAEQKYQHDRHKAKDQHDRHKAKDQHDRHKAKDQHDRHKAKDQHDRHKAKDQHDRHKAKDQHDRHKAKDQHDRHKAKDPCFKLGESVLAQSFAHGPTWVCGKVQQCCGSKTYLVELTVGRVWRRHVDNLRKLGGGKEFDLSAKAPEQDQKSDKVVPDIADEEEEQLPQFQEEEKVTAPLEELEEGDDVVEDTPRETERVDLPNQGGPENRRYPRRENRRPPDRL